jgi:ATP-dependent DNA helicase RecG
LPPSLTPALLRLPHASIPRNPLLAEPLFLTRHIEKAGTGILDMIGLCKAAKLRPPEFRQEMGQFIQTLWRPKVSTEPPIETPGGAKSALSRHQVGQTQPTQSATQSPTQSDDPVGCLLLALKSGPQSAGELRELLELKHRPTFRQNYLHPALEKGLIENTIPDKPNSRLQKYRLTEKGRGCIKEKA